MSRLNVSILIVLLCWSHLEFGIRAQDIETTTFELETTTVDETTTLEPEIKIVQADLKDVDENEEIEEIQMDPITGRRMYNQFQLFRAQPQTEEQLGMVRFIAKGVQDLWSPVPANVTKGVSIDMLVGPKHSPYVAKFLNCSGVPYDIAIHDIQRAIEEENEVTDTVTRSTNKEYRKIRSKRANLFSDLVRNLFGFETKTIGTQYLPGQLRPVRQSRYFNSNQPQPALPTPGPVYYKPVQASENHSEPRPQSPIHSPSSSSSYTKSSSSSSSSSGACMSEVGLSWDLYHRMDVIQNYMTCLARRYAGLVTLHDLGQTDGRRHLKVVEISQPKGSNKPAIWIDGGIHAREWISPASVTYMLSELVENSAYHQDLLSKYSFYIMPVMNPDGYEFTHTNDRLWRKARSSTYHPSCIGTDLNRNWGYKYGGKGASPNACDETYRGPSAFSAKETKAASNFILQRAHNMKMFLTFHSYGQYILYPWGYTANDEPSNWRDLHRIGQIGAQAMLKKNGHSYSVGSAAKLLYPAAGGSDDWAKGGAGIEYSYTIELPDSGLHGFLLPATQIRSVTQEAFAGVEAMVNAL